MNRSHFLSVLLLIACAPIVVAAGRARHVVLVVFDGMRPDFVTKQAAPTLAALAEQGVFFQNHHSVFIT